MEEIRYHQIYDPKAGRMRPDLRLAVVQKGPERWVMVIEKDDPSPASSALGAVVEAAKSVFASVFGTDDNPW